MLTHSKPRQSREFWLRWAKKERRCKGRRRRKDAASAPPPPLLASPVALPPSLVLCGKMNVASPASAVAKSWIHRDKNIPFWLRRLGEKRVVKTNVEVAAFATRQTDNFFFFVEFRSGSGRKVTFPSSSSSLALDLGTKGVIGGEEGDGWGMETFLCPHFFANVGVDGGSSLTHSHPLFHFAKTICFCISHARDERCWEGRMGKRGGKGFRESVVSLEDGHVSVKSFFCGGTEVFAPVGFNNKLEVFLRRSFYSPLFLLLEKFWAQMEHAMGNYCIQG